MNEKAFVLLSFAQDAAEWQAKWSRGEKGLNPRFPYEYNLASDFGMSVTYSTSHPENGLERLVRLGIGAILGFDLVHAWRNRTAFFESDVVWTHTETQGLAASLLRRLCATRKGKRPILIAQVIWLFDTWPHLPNIKKRLYFWLLSQAEAITVHSPLNMTVARTIFPRSRVEIVKYGINTDFVPLAKSSPLGRTTRIVSIGNDRHRDWDTLVAAIKLAPDIEARIATTASVTGVERNVSVVKCSLTADLLDLYDWADIVVLALKPNLHASGLTVIEESAMLGVPVVCSNVGGLEYYFRDGEVQYVEPAQPKQLLEAVRAIACDDARRQSLIQNARLRLVDAGLTSRDFVKRHVDLSRQLLDLNPDRFSR